MVFFSDLLLPSHTLNLLSTFDQSLVTLLKLEMNPPGKDDPSRSRPPPSQPVNSGPSYYSQPPYPPTTSRQLYDPFGGPVLDVGFTPSPYSQVNNRETFRTPALPSQPNISPVYERHEHGSASYARSSQIPWSHRGGSDLNMANEADTSRRSSGELSTNYGYNDPRTSPQLSMNHRPRGNTVGNKVTDEEEIYPSSEEMQSDPEIVDAGSRPEQTLRIRAKTEGGENDAFDAKMDHRKRKRNRTIRSCVPCHNHKRKVSPRRRMWLRKQCDRKRPCGRCTALGLVG